MLVTVFDTMIECRFIRHIVQTVLGPRWGRRRATPRHGSHHIGPARPEGVDAHIAAIKARFGLGKGGREPQRTVFKRLLFRN
jgi:hypothetical protein